MICCGSTQTEVISVTYKWDLIMEGQFYGRGNRAVSWPYLHPFPCPTTIYSSYWKGRSRLGLDTDQMEGPLAELLPSGR